MQGKAKIGQDKTMWGEGENPIPQPCPTPLPSQSVDLKCHNIPQMKGTLRNCLVQSYQNKEKLNKKQKF